MSVREMAERLGVAFNTARRVFDDLEAYGFIQCAEASSFSRKDRTAREWRLTCEQCDRTGRAASKEFRRWKPECDFRTQTQPVSTSDAMSDSVVPLNKAHGRNG